MSMKPFTNVSYGLTQSLITNSPYPIASKRNPTANDFAIIGSIWSNVTTSTVYILASIIANVATWIQVAPGGGAGVFSALTVQGTTNINTASASVTSLGTGGTGAVHIGNATGGTTVTGAFTSSGGAINLNATGANAVNIGIAPGTGAVHIGNATGDTYIDNGALVVTNASITIVAADQGYVLPTGVVVLSGGGDPNGNLAFSAPIGSLYLNSTGSTTTNRLFINTDGGTTWTYFTSHA